LNAGAANDFTSANGRVWHPRHIVRFCGLVSGAYGSAPSACLQSFVALVARAASVMEVMALLTRQE